MIQMYSYKDLGDTEIEEIHRAFLDAFSNYQVRMDLPLEKFKAMLIRNGYVPEVSVGAFYNDKLVGFILNGMREYNGKLKIYDSGTGIIADHRNKGLTANIFNEVRTIAEKKGVSQYLLEVIKTNTPALTIYQKQGFKILRDLQCFYCDKVNMNLESSIEVKKEQMPVGTKWEKLMNFWDKAPSWQNSVDSVAAVADDYYFVVAYMNNEVAGYGIIGRKSGDIPQLAVNKKYRRKGLGKSILKELINSTDAEKIGIINVDDSCNTMKEFLYKVGFEIKISQYEMALLLNCGNEN